MVDDDVLFGFRLRLFGLAAELGNVREACRIFGRPPLDLLPLAGTGPALGPRDAPAAGAPATPDAQPDEPARRAAHRGLRLGHPGLGPRRISASLAQERWGGIVISPNGVWRVLRRHGLSRRISRLSLVAGYAAPPGPEPAGRRSSATSRSTTRASWSASTASTWAGCRARAGRVWQYTAIDLASLATSGPSCTPRRSTRRPGTRAGLARRVAADLRAHGWRLERVLTDNGSEFRSPVFGAHHPGAGCHPDLHPCRSSGHQRRGRAGPADHPRGVLAAGLRAEPRAQARRASAGTSRATCATTTRSVPTPVA